MVYSKAMKGLSHPAFLAVRRFLPSIPVVLIGGAVILGFFIIGKASLSSTHTPAKNEEGAPSVSAAPTQSPTEPNPLALAARPLLPSPVPNLSSGQSAPPPAKNGATGNATELLAREIASRVIGTNPNDPKALLNEQTLTAALESESALQETLSGALGGGDAHTFTGTVRPGEIRVVNPTAQAVRSYLASISAIASRATEAGNILEGNPSLASFLELQRLMGTVAGELAALPAPRTFAAWHESFLKLARTEQNLFGTIADALTDPLKALWALQLLPGLQEQHLALQKEFEDLVRSATRS